jgi:hypothetical protein
MQGEWRASWACTGGCRGSYIQSAGSRTRIKGWRGSTRLPLTARWKMLKM